MRRRSRFVDALLLEKIDREARIAPADGNDARIIAKINSLNEPGMVDALYEASSAGVKIDLIVPRHLLACGRVCLACPKTSACARSLGASSNTRASTTSG